MTRHRWRCCGVEVNTCRRCGLRRKLEAGKTWYLPSRARGWRLVMPACPGGGAS